MTFSIVARDEATGAFGVATATGGPAVGSLVPYGRAGAGAVATQGYTTNPFYGFNGLGLLDKGREAQAVMDVMTGADAGRDRRQCVLVDRAGRTAAWTGDEVSAWCGSILGQGVAVAGNLLAGPDVLEAMVDAYKGAAAKPLEDRLLAALAAGENAGGDRRGTLSAALKVYTTEPYPAVDLREDWSEFPILSLGEVLRATRGVEYGDFFSRLPTNENPGAS